MCILAPAKTPAARSPSSPAISSAWVFCSGCREDERALDPETRHLLRQTGERSDPEDHPCRRSLIDETAGRHGSPSDRQPAAVDGQDMAGHHARGAAREVKDAARHLLGLGKAAHRRTALDRPDHLGIAPEALGETGAHIGRRDGVDPYARRPLGGQCPGHIDQGALRRLVGEVRIEAAADQSHDRGDIDDPAAGAGEHHPSGFAAGYKGRGHVDVHDPAPVLDAEALGRIALGGPDIIDDDVDPPEARDRRRHHVGRSGRHRRRRAATHGPGRRRIRSPPQRRPPRRDRCR